jgi:hypothetical protein
MSNQQQAVEDKKEPRSLAIAAKGIKTGADFANLMSGLMSDLVEGRVTPAVGHATCNAGGKLLKIVEMQYKYGTNGKGNGPRTLLLAVDDAPVEKGAEKSGALAGA